MRTSLGEAPSGIRASRNGLLQAPGRSLQALDRLEGRAAEWCAAPLARRGRGTPGGGRRIVWELGGSTWPTSARGHRATYEALRLLGNLPRPMATEVWLVASRGASVQEGVRRPEGSWVLTRRSEDVRLRATAGCDSALQGGQAADRRELAKSSRTQRASSPGRGVIHR